MSKGGKDKILVIQVAGLGYDFLVRHNSLSMAGLDYKPAETVFPAVTCTVQASFRTASVPALHGMVGNGLYNRRLRKPMFWEQSSALVEGERFWASAKKSGKKTAMLFWQQSMGEDVDILLSPAPIHKHHGGMILDCYSQPAGLYKKLCDSIGRPFALRNYWGPLANEKSSQWIAEAVVHVMKNEAPDLCLAYLPVLDYNLQRCGTGAAGSVEALDALKRQLELLRGAAEREGYELVIFGDYAIADCPKGAVYPNRILADAGLLKLRDIRGMKYPDFHTSRAFVMVDHEVGHVFIRDPGDIEQIADLLTELEGIVMDHAAQEKAGIAHLNSGELTLLAEEGAWLAYPWWTDAREAPDYASHVDIHNKPGYDPCELFWGWPPGSVSQNTARIKGTHGRVGPTRKVAWASTCIDGTPETLVELAGAVRKIIEG